MKNSLPYFRVPGQNVLFRGSYIDCFGEEIGYIVYCNGDTVNVNSDFTIDSKGAYHCCGDYDRVLCRTAAEYERLSEEEIERQARFAYTDGAR